MGKIILKLTFLACAVALSSQSLFTGEAGDNVSSDKENSSKEKKGKRDCCLSTEGESPAKKLKLTRSTDQLTTPQNNPLPKLTNNISKIENASLKDVEDYMNGLSIPLQNVLLVLDVDGTLTNRSIPGRKTKPRGNAVQFVTDMVDKGVKVVVSSSWDNFDETLDRLE